jgi:hypothetical protein
MALGFPGRSARRFTVDLPLVALSLTALAHWIRGAPADAVIFLTVALMLVITEWRGIREDTVAAQPLRVPGVAVLATGLLVLSFGRASVPVIVAISIIGLASLYAEWRDPSLPADRPVPRGSWMWAAVGVSWLAWEFISFVYEQGAGGLSLTHPTMSDLIDPLLTNRIPQTVAITGWLAAGLAMLRAAAAARRS